MEFLALKSKNQTNDRQKEAFHVPLFFYWIRPQATFLEFLPPIARYRKKSQPLIRGSLGFRGSLSMMSRSGGLNPRAVAGSPSVTRFTQSSWTGIKASGRPKMAVRKILEMEEAETLVKGEV